MRESNILKVDGEQYECALFAGTKGTRVLARLIKMFGKSLVGLVGLAGKKGGMKAKIDDSMVETFMGAIESLDEDALELLFSDLLSTVRFADKKAGWIDVASQQDTIFMGRQFHKLKVIIAIAQYQFADFFAKPPAVSK